MTPTDDLEALLDQARTGDKAALAKVLEAVGPTVRQRIAPKLKGSPHRASLDEDDVMQVTYLEAVIRLQSFTTGGISGFIAWLSRMAENNLIDAIRALESAKRPNPRKRVRAPSGQQSMVMLVEMLGGVSLTPSRDAARGEGVDLLAKAIDALPRDYARVVRGHDLEGKPASELAQELGRSEGAIYMLRSRAHARLKELLGSDSKFFTKQG